jgi:hypothetical protein
MALWTNVGGLLYVAFFMILLLFVLSFVFVKHRILIVLSSRVGWFFMNGSPSFTWRGKPRSDVWGFDARMISLDDVVHF